MKKLNLFPYIILGFLPLCISQNINALNISDLYKKYGAAYFIGLEGMTYDPYIVEINKGEETNEIVLTGLLNEEAEIHALFNSENSSLTISPQDLYYSQKDRLMIQLRFVDINVESGFFENDIQASINEEGKINFPDNIILLIGNEDYGWYWGGYNLSLTPFFEFNVQEWKEAGKGLFKDGWISPYFGEETFYSMQPYEVEILESIKNPGEFLMVNPYNNIEFKELLKSELGGKVAETGYIHFNCQDPDFIYAYPLVDSGASINLNYLGSGYTTEQIYNFNNEGYLIFSGDSKEEIINYLNDQMLPISNYDPDSKTAYFYNCRFAFEEEPLYGYYWNISSWNNPNAILFSTLEFDVYAEVKSIENSNPFGGEKYYNLQGKEIAHPAKGQIVIRCKEGKTSKMIIR